MRACNVAFYAKKPMQTNLIREILLGSNIVDFFFIKPRCNSVFDPILFYTCLLSDFRYLSIT